MSVVIRLRLNKAKRLSDLEIFPTSSAIVLMSPHPTSSTSNTPTATIDSSLPTLPSACPRNIRLRSGQETEKNNGSKSAQVRRGRGGVTAFAKEEDAVPSFSLSTKLSIARLQLACDPPTSPFFPSFFAGRPGDLLATIDFSHRSHNRVTPECMQASIFVNWRWFADCECPENITRGVSPFVACWIYAIVIHHLFFSSIPSLLLCFLL